MAEAHAITATVECAWEERATTYADDLGGTIQVVIAAALPPTLGSQPVEIANQQFKRQSRVKLEHRTIMSEIVLTFARNVRNCAGMETFDSVRIVGLAMPRSMRAGLPD